LPAKEPEQPPFIDTEGHQIKKMAIERLYKVTWQCHWY